MNKRFEKLVVGLLLLIVIRITKDYRTVSEEVIIDQAMKFLQEG